MCKVQRAYNAPGIVVVCLHVLLQIKLFYFLFLAI